MGKNQLVLAFFANEAAADTAVESLKAWDKASDDIKLGAIGVMALDENGKLKTHKLGARSTARGAGIGLVLVLITPVGLVAGLVGGAILGALHHRNLLMNKAEGERIGQELAGGKAAVGVMAKSDEATVVALKLAELGGTSHTYDLSDADLAEADAAVENEPPAAEAEGEAPAATTDTTEAASAV